MAHYPHAAPSASASMSNSKTHINMKNIKWSSLFIGLICLCSCVDLTELNENPTKATSISPHLLIPTIQLTHSQYMQNTIRYFIYPGAFVNHWIGGWSMQEYDGKAKKNIAYMERLWVAYYPDIIKNAVALVSQTTDNPEEINLNAIGRILKVEAFLKLTDYYGDIPYFEAGKIYNENIVKPRYDKQEDIYKAIFAQLDKALEGLDTETAGLASFDCWCNGDRTLWKKIANQLKLRMALRIVKVNPVDAEKYAKEAIQAGVLEDKDILINKSYSNELRRMMDWLDSGIGSSIVAFMNGYNDPRRPLYFTTNVRHLVKKTAEPTGEKDQNNEDIYNESDILIRKGAQYIGVPVGCELGNKNGGNDNQRVYYSFLAGGYATPQPIMFAAEGWFLRAEAKLRWTDAGQQSVKELYEKGIEVSIRNQKSYRQSDAAAAWTEKKLTAPDWAAIDDAAISSYINDDTSSPEGYTDPWKPEYNSDPTTSITVKWDEGASNEEKLERIITQKWIANFPLSTEAWADYRRTGYPKLFRPKQNLAPSIIDTQLGPRRLLYNETELSSNTVEVNNAIQLLKAESSEVKGDGDTGGTRLWWDRKDKGNF